MAKVPIVQLTTPAGRRSLIRRAVAAGCLVLTVAVLAGLGTWQVERLVWKHALIARVEARIHAAPVPPPSLSGEQDARGDEYRRVRVSGTFLNDREATVTALTERGAGFWVMTPLQRADGSIILINRGFVPTDRRAASTRPAGNPQGTVMVTGLLRLSEPGGSLLQANRPQDDRWYSRDVEAIARARDLSQVAAYFIDADETPNPGGLPVGGLTRVVFANNHLVYAATWYTLAILLAGAGVFLVRKRSTG